jgi:hypothetical protein
VCTDSCHTGTSELLLFKHVAPAVCARARETVHICRSTSTNSSGLDAACDGVVLQRRPKQEVPNGVTLAFDLQLRKASRVTSCSVFSLDEPFLYF